MDGSPCVAQNGADMNVMNQKLQYDAAAQLQNQSLIDNQSNARARASLDLRAAEDAQTIKHLAVLNLITASQTGETEDEQTVDPMRTGAGDQVAANVADLATSLVPVIASALAAAISQSIAALVPAVVTAAGGASTPSQTQAKPAA